MPEVAEVAHACSILKRNIIGSKINHIKVHSDNLVFPYLKEFPEGTKSIEQSLVGSTVQKIGRHGKYFWIRFDKNLVMLMHFGMTGVIRLKGVKSHLIFMEREDKKVLKELEKTSKYFKKEKAEFKSVDMEEPIEKVIEESWPPRFSKLEISFNNHEFSFSDGRRLARIRLFTDIKEDQDLFKIEPLNRQGPDYSKNKINDPDPTTYIPPLTLSEFSSLLITRNKPIKSFLLDQQYFAGVGNWVGDEICYHCKIHPSSNFYNCEDSKLIASLYNSITEITRTAVIVEGNVKEFPTTWLMPYRWGKKRKKEAKPKVNGETIDFVTIGGRTSCFVPKVQKLVRS